MKTTLFFTGKGEKLTIGDRAYDLPILGITREYTRAYAAIMLELSGKRLFDVGPWAAQEIARRVGLAFGLEDYTDQAYRLPHGTIFNDYATALDTEGKWLWLLREYDSLMLAVVLWLMPLPRRDYKPDSFHEKYYFTPQEMYLMDNASPDQIFLVTFFQDHLSVLLRNKDLFRISYTLEVFNHRINEVQRRVLIEMEQEGTSYNQTYLSSNLLALTWIEIEWCLQHNQYAFICEQCLGAFPLGRPYKRKAYLCSPECRKARQIELAGGVESLRRAWAEAKRDSRERIRQGKRRRRRGF